MATASIRQPYPWIRAHCIATPALDYATRMHGSGWTISIPTATNRQSRFHLSRIMAGERQSQVTTYIEPAATEMVVRDRGSSVRHSRRRAQTETTNDTVSHRIPDLRRVGTANDRNGCVTNGVYELDAKPTSRNPPARSVPVEPPVVERQRSPSPTGLKQENHSTLGLASRRACNVRRAIACVEWA